MISFDSGLHTLSLSRTLTFIKRSVMRNRPQLFRALLRYEIHLCNYNAATYAGKCCLPGESFEINSDSIGLSVRAPRACSVRARRAAQGSSIDEYPFATTANANEIN